MIKRSLLVFIFTLAYFVLVPAPHTASAFQGPGCMGKCTDCHNLSKEDAAKVLKADRFKAQIKDVRMSPVKGLWEVEIAQGDKSFIVYVDFAKKFLVEGKFTALEQLGESQPLKKIDTKKIPLENAIIYGSPKADKKVIVFDDPECPYCAKLHEEIKKIIATRKDIAFYIKMYPLDIHPAAYEKSKTIACLKSPKLLEDAFAGKKIPKPECDSPEVDNNKKLAEELGIRGTPALIMPDGRVFPGYAPADVLLGIIDNQ
ncbi:MAG: DsbC family protein [Deltaproteobacteria bacterium]|nr:DsbC family protein [Deltaproteobacteria bacterium]